MKTLLERCGFHKRSGFEVNSIVYCLTMWVWLKSNSVSLRALHLRVARKASQQLAVPGGVTVKQRAIAHFMFNNFE